MENVTDQTSNPFGMRAPCERRCSEDVLAVYGYGDANADFHLIGDHPVVHGGVRTGVPFTESTAGERLQSVLFDLGFSTRPYDDEPAYENLFSNYLYMCCPDGEKPKQAEYDRLERYFDAELRAINAHILLPVGERATAHVLEEYTTLAHKLNGDVPSLHASEVRGRGFMVIPVREPADWTGNDRNALVEKLESILASDYRQTKGVATLVG